MQQGITAVAPLSDSSTTKQRRTGGGGCREAEASSVNVSGNKPVNLADKGIDNRNDICRILDDVNIKIEPLRVDLFYSTTPIVREHRVINDSPTPVIFRVKVSAPGDYVVRPVTGRISGNSITTIKITRRAHSDEPHSTRFDVEFVPEKVCVISRNKWAGLSEAALQYALFDTNLQPLVSTIRYHAPSPLTNLLRKMDDCQGIKVPQNIRDAFEAIGYPVPADRTTLPLNHCIILDRALHSNPDERDQLDPTQPMD